MKINALLAFFFFFALFASTTADFVSDNDGDWLKNGSSYYLVSPFPPRLTYKAVLGAKIDKDNGSCSLAVLYKDWINMGDPVKISSASLHHDCLITTDSPLWISFAHLPFKCTKNSQWLVIRDIAFGEDTVMAGDAKEFPNPLSGWFYIKPYDPVHYYYYKLFFCFSQVNCGYVGVKTDNTTWKAENGRLVIVTQDDKKIEPLKFKFQKYTVEDVAAASDISMVV